MEKFPMMLYRVGGSEDIHGGKFATLIVGDEDSLSAAKADGWAESTPEALEAAKPKEAPPVPVDARALLEQEATALGIKFDGRWGDKKLTDAIAAAKG